MNKKLLHNFATISVDIVNDSVNEEVTNKQKWVPLMPLGEINARDGRKFSNPNPEAVIETTRKDGIHRPFDIEHSIAFLNEAQALAKTSADISQLITLQMRAMPIGWITDYKVTAGFIWGLVDFIEEWYVDNKLFKYISPTFYTNSSGEITSISGASFVAQPAFSMPAIASIEHLKNKGLDMEKEEIIASLKNENVKQNEEIGNLNIKITKQNEEIASLAAENKKLSLDLLAEKNKTEAASKAEIIDKAISASKITPALREHYINIATKLSFEELQQMVETMPSLNLATKQAPQNSIASGTEGLTPAVIAGLKSRGWSDEEIAKYNINKENN